MKKYFSNISSLLNRLFLALALVVCVSSCDSVIYDYEDNCDPVEGPGDPAGPGKPNEPEADAFYVKFIFERNMQFVDAFSERVNSVDLYVFNTSGTFVTRYHEDGLPLKDKEYLMLLEGLPAGTYELVAWCGLKDNNYFSVPTDAEISQRHHVVCTMATSIDGNRLYQNNNLAPLFHGLTASATYVKDGGKQVKDVYLTKDTNNINLTLQHKDGIKFEKGRFVVSMTDNNHIMRYDNSINEQNETVEYRPYRYTIYDVETKSRADETMGNGLQVELSVARLMKDHNPIITVTDTETGNAIFSIPIVKWALQLRSNNYKNIEDQEYLDREDNFNLMLWLDNGEDGWFGAEIEIIDWHAIDSEEDLQ